MPPSSIGNEHASLDNLYLQPSLLPSPVDRMQPKVQTKGEESSSEVAPPVLLVQNEYKRIHHRLVLQVPHLPRILYHLEGFHISPFYHM